MITVSRVEDRAGLEALAPEWTAMVERSLDATPFQRPEWIVPWWRWFGSGELHALAFRSRERLVGFLPVFIHPWKDRRQVTLVGAGITDCLGLIAEPQFAGHCARHAYAYLRAHEDRWDVCDWQDLGADSPLVSHAREWFDATEAPDTPCLRMHLPISAAEYDASLSSELRRDLRRFTRKLIREGTLEFDTVKGDVALLAELYRLHQARWARTGGPASNLDRADTQQFLCEASRRMAAVGKLRLYAMKYRGRVAGVILALSDRGIVWDLITGMDPELARFSPGSLLLRYAIGDAIGEGARTWDFLRGEEQYKFRWGARSVRKSRLTVLSRATVAPIAAAESTRRAC